MDVFTDYDELPKKMKLEIQRNSSDMNAFYSTPAEDRGLILERITACNSRPKINRFIR